MKLLSGFLSDDGVTPADRHRIRRGTIHSFLIQGISIALVFASNWWLVRSTDTTSYGVYVHVFNWVSILGILAAGGRDDLVLALLPKYVAAGEGSRVVRLVRSVNAWIFGLTLLVGAGFIGLISLAPLHTLSEHRDLFLIAVAAVYFSAFLTVNQMILQALDHIRLSQVIEKLVRPLLLILATGLFHLSAAHFNDHTLVWLGTGVSAGCSLLIGVIIVRRMRKFSELPPVHKVPERHAGKTSWFFLVSLFNLLATKITMLLLPLFTPEADIGIFNIAYRYADLLIFPFFLMHSVLPQLFARHSLKEKESTRALYNESTRLMTLISIPLLTLIIIAGPFLLRIFGSAFDMGYRALIFISLAQFLFSVFGPANTILMTQGKERFSALCLAGYVAVLFITSRILIPLQGITGGALAILISSAAYNGALNILIYRIYGIATPFLSPGKRRQ